jgi:putative salt-induced outer membrane protein YdiY
MCGQSVSAWANSAIDSIKVNPLEELDSTALHYMPPGSYVFIPASVSYFIRAVGETIVEMHRGSRIPVEAPAFGERQSVVANASTAPTLATSKPPVTLVSGAMSSRARWARSVAFSYSLSRGNADVSDGILSGKAKRIGQRSRFQLESLWRRGTRDGKSTSHRFLTGIRLDQSLPWQLATPSKPSFLQEITYETDRIQKLNSRTIVNVGLSVPIAGSGENILALEVGAGLTREHFKEIEATTHKSGFFRANSGQRIFGAAKFAQQLAAIPDFNTPNRYRFTGDANLQAPLSKVLSLRMVFNSRYDTKPQPDVKRHDFTLMSGIGVDF